MPTEWETASLLDGQNAYTDWALGPGEPYLLTAKSKGEVWFPIILRLSGDSAEKVLLANAESIRVSQIYGNAVRQTTGERYATALVTRGFFDIFKDKTIHLTIPQVTIGLPIQSATLAVESKEGETPLPNGSPQPGMVVVGVIDDGIALAHERFCRIDAAGTRHTRVEYAWIQGADSVRSSPVLYGREFRRDEIDGLLKSSEVRGVVDEDKLYRQVGLEDFSRTEHPTTAWRTAHGTHVMDLVCGAAPDAAPESMPIVCVQLPALATQDTSGVRLEPQLLAGIDYILDRADRIANARGCGRLPVVINFSYGFLAGPHDGTHPIEGAIDDVISQRTAAGQKVCVVLPAGNGHLARCHAQVCFGSCGEERTLDWRVLPDDQTSSFLEIWLPPSGGPPAESRVELSITPPGGQASTALSEGVGQALVWKPNNRDVLCKVSYEFVHSSGRGRFMVALLPTAFHDAPTQLAPSGVWKVSLKNILLTESDRVELWIQRDDTPYGYPRRGRQSHFEDACYRRFDQSGHEVEEDDGASQVRRAGSISAIGTGRNAVVIGGFLRNEMAPAAYSAGGPVSAQAGAEKPHRCGPDALAVSDDSKVHRGVLAAGSRSGSIVAMNGTSVAAPQVARWVVSELAEGRTVDRSSVTRRANDDELKAPPMPQRPTQQRGGAGRLRLPQITRLPRHYEEGPSVQLPEQPQLHPEGGQGRW